MNEIIINTISMITLFLINYMKYKYDNKGLQKKNAEAHEFLLKKIDELESVIKESISKKDFRNKLINNISNTAFNVISSNSDLMSDIINILNQFQSQITEFAIKYIDSPYRENKKKVENYIDIEIDTIFNDVRYLSNNTFRNTKTNINFYDFLQNETNINTLKNVLIQRLQENGLSKEQYINLFTNFTKNILLEIIKGYRLWLRRY